MRNAARAFPAPTRPSPWQLVSRPGRGRSARSAHPQTAPPFAPVTDKSGTMRTLRSPTTCASVAAPCSPAGPMASTPAHTLRLRGACRAIASASPSARKRMASASPVACLTCAPACNSAMFHTLFRATTCCCGCPPRRSRARLTPMLLAASCTS